MWPENISCWKLFWRILDLEKERVQVLDMLPSARWIDGQSRTWWGCVRGLWLVEFLWRKLVPMGLPFVSLPFMSLWELGSPWWEKGHSRPWRASARMFHLGLIEGLLPPSFKAILLPPLLPCFSSSFSLWATIIYLILGLEKQALHVCLWTFLSRAAFTDFVSVSTRDDLACQWEGVMKRKSCRRSLRMKSAT